MFDPSFGRMSIRIETFFILDNKLSLLMKLIKSKSDNIILRDYEEFNKKKFFTNYSDNR